MQGEVGEVRKQWIKFLDRITTLLWFWRSSKSDRVPAPASAGEEVRDVSPHLVIKGGEIVVRVGGRRLRVKVPPGKRVLNLRGAGTCRSDVKLVLRVRTERRYLVLRNDEDRIDIVVGEWLFGCDGYRAKRRMVCRRLKAPLGARELMAAGCGTSLPNLKIVIDRYDPRRPAPKSCPPTAELPDLQHKVNIVQDGLRRWASAPPQRPFEFTKIVESFNAGQDWLDSTRRVYEVVDSYVSGSSITACRPRFAGISACLPPCAPAAYVTTTRGEAVVDQKVVVSPRLEQEPIEVVAVCLAHERCHGLVRELGLASRLSKAEEEKLVDAAVAAVGLLELYVRAVRRTPLNAQIGYYSRQTIEGLWSFFSQKSPTLTA